MNAAKTGRKLFWQFLLVGLCAAGLAGIILAALVTSRAASLREEKALAVLEGQALALRGALESWRAEHSAESSAAFFSGLNVAGPTVFTLYSREGAVLAASGPRQPEHPAPLAQLEVAVSRRLATEVRAAPGGPVAEVAVPITDAGGRIEVIMASARVDAFDAAPPLGVAGAIVLVLAVLVLAAGAARAGANIVAEPVVQLRRAAERMRAGGPIERLVVPEAQELGLVTESLNELIAAWDGRLQAALRQRNEQEAVLSSMVEGVLAVDSQHNVISINQAAAKLVGVDQSLAQGQALAEIVRNSALQNFVAQALHAAEPIKDEITLHQRGRTQIIEAHGARLRGTAGAGIGAVVVLNDVTELRRLEQVRRDFVSNVSHELKTPVTSIKGFVETLLDGAMNNPDDARRFLEIVQRQAERLNAIIEDLLTLSRLEQHEQAADEMLEIAPLAGPLAEAVELCTPAAVARGIRIDVNCDPGIRARINTNLIQQGVVNLIDNAIKYSEPNTSVSVEAMETVDEILIFVRDQGCGISPVHLPRLFERFYRIDRARSRDMGGTGLGLSIVRHIVQSHRGHVTVESTPGVGSSFCIHLPNPANAAAPALA